MLNLTRLHLGIAHESQFQGFGITGSIPVASTIVSRLAVAVLSRKPAFGDRLPSRLL
jgi:hypothetical protein